MKAALSVEMPIKGFYQKLIAFADEIGSTECSALLKSEDYDSIGGYMIGLLDHFPDRGEQVADAAGNSLRAVKVDGNRIEKVRLVLAGSAGNAGSTGSAGSTGGAKDAAGIFGYASGNSVKNANSAGDAQRPESGALE